MNGKTKGGLITGILLTFIVATAVGYGELKNKVNNLKKAPIEIAEMKKDVEHIKEDLTEVKESQEKMSMEQKKISDEQIKMSSTLQIIKDAVLNR